MAKDSLTPSWPWMNLGVAAACLAATGATAAMAVIGSAVDISLSTLPYAAVGAILVWRRRGQVVGWVLLAFAVFWSVTFLATELALSDRPGSVVVVASWLSEWTWVPAIVSVFVVLPIVFPTGEPYRRSWRAILWLALVLVVAYAALSTMQTQFSADDVKVVDNPWALLAMSDAEDVLFPLVLPLLLVGPLAAVMRYRQSAGAEREQLRWFMYAVVATAVVFFGVNVAASLLGGLFETVAVVLALSLPPVGIWIAITRYRLYDIDRIVSRTVTYAAVTALLVGTYAAVVFAVGRLFPSQGSLAVVASTLTVAALFNPVRRRIQRAVDQRFNRPRYDAQRTVEDFGRQLRGEGTPLESLEGELVGIVAKAMQPTSVSVWVKDEPALRG